MIMLIIKYVIGNENEGRGVSGIQADADAIASCSFCFLLDRFLYSYEKKLTVKMNAKNKLHHKTNLLVINLLLSISSIVVHRRSKASV